MAKTACELITLQMAEAFLKTKGIYVHETCLIFSPVKDKQEAWEVRNQIQSIERALRVVLGQDVQIETSDDGVQVKGQTVARYKRGLFSAKFSLIQPLAKLEIHTVKFGDFFHGLLDGLFDVLLGGPKAA